jgi:opacity protein-like surface antigen
MSKRLAAAFLACLALAAAPSARAEDPSVVTFGAGLYDLVSHRSHAFEGRAMFRLGQGLLGGDGVFRGLKPTAGVMFATNESMYGYAGLAAPFRWGRWELEASAGVGAYHKGKGLELGGVFEFHLGAGVSYAVTDSVRIGAMLTHVSNAGTHKVNPGLNSALGTVGFTF